MSKESTQSDMDKIEILTWMFHHLDLETLSEMKTVAQISKENASPATQLRKQPVIND